MTTAEVRSLPPALSTDEAARLLGVTREHLWKCAREGTAPVPFLRLGKRQLRWPTAPILRVLGIEDGS